MASLDRENSMRTPAGEPVVGAARRARRDRVGRTRVVDDLQDLSDRPSALLRYRPGARVCVVAGLRGGALASVETAANGRQAGCRAGRRPVERTR